MGLPAENSCSLNLTSLKDDDNLLAISLAWVLCPDKPSLIRLLISELLPTEFLWSLSISYSFSMDSSSSWGPKFSDTSPSSLGIGVSCLDCIRIERTPWKNWLVYPFMCLVSLFVNFILFPHLGQLYILVDNNVRILFRLRFRITSIKSQE